MKEVGTGKETISANVSSVISDRVLPTKKWTIRKYNSNEDYINDTPFEVCEFGGNVLLNEGITVLQQLLTNSGSQPSPYSNASASLGVGTTGSGTPESATQTGLVSNTHAYATMSSGYPQVSSSTTTWRAVFGSGSANFDWREFTISNSQSNAGDNLNRKVSNQGTKAAGQTWTLDLDITWS